MWSPIQALKLQTGKNHNSKVLHCPFYMRETSSDTKNRQRGCAKISDTL